MAAGKVGAATEPAAVHKVNKYSSLSACYCFIPIAFVNRGILGSAVVQLLADLGQNWRQHSNDNESDFLFQKVSAAIQRYNATLLHNSFVVPDDSNS